jgi:hypothetical protein
LLKPFFPHRVFSVLFNPAHLAPFLASAIFARTATTSRSPIAITPKIVRIVTNAPPIMPSATQKIDQVVLSEFVILLHSPFFALATGSTIRRTDLLEVFMGFLEGDICHTKYTKD